MSLLPKLSGKIRQAATPAGIGGLWKFWKSVGGASLREITTEAERPVHLALVGTPDQTRMLAARLALETSVPNNSPDGPAEIGPYLSHYESPGEVPPSMMTLDAVALTLEESRLAAAIAEIVVDYPDMRLALARHIPAFRPAVTARLIQEVSWSNAKIAVISALPGVIPFTDVLMPITAAGDLVVLTRHQVMLLLRIAAAYGRDVDLRARVRELLPVVGSAFGWRALARELLGLVPGGIGVVVKGAVAYAGTYTVGKGAAIFYSTGQALPNARLRQLYKASFKDALVRIRQLVKREKRVAAEPKFPAPPSPLLRTSATAANDGDGEIRPDD
jgi:uncharacterized protein (DUF697 family)